MENIPKILANREKATTNLTSIVAEVKGQWASGHFIEYDISSAALTEPNTGMDSVVFQVPDTIKSNMELQQKCI